MLLLPFDCIEGLRQRVTVTEAGCWEWSGARDPTGYGAAGKDGKKQGAHRIAYEIVNGPIPPGLDVDHLCRNRPCCNPDHLEAVSRAENVRRAIVAKRAT